MKLLEVVNYSVDLVWQYGSESNSRFYVAYTHPAMDAGNTVGTAQDRYKQDSFDIIDMFGETATASLSTADSTTDLLNSITSAMAIAATDMGDITNQYSAVVERLNELIGGDAPFAENLNKFVSDINAASDNYLETTKNAVNVF